MNDNSNGTQTRDNDYFRNNEYAPRKSSFNQRCQSEILNQLENKDSVNQKNIDLRQRATKIVCTLGKETIHEAAIRKLIDKGMDVARINMSYFETDQESNLINTINKVAEE